MSKKNTNEANPRGIRLGLTGGMGCGKSAAAEFFAELGFGIIDSDKIVRELWETDAEVKTAAQKRWGGEVLKPDGSIDRRAVAQKVFAEPKELECLEGLLHPRVRLRWQTILASAPQKDWVVEIPLLFEKNLASEFDFTLCVWASPALQAARLVARGFSPAEITARQARQWPLREKADRADLVALNDGSLDFLRRQIIRFAGQLHEPAK